MAPGVASGGFPGRGRGSDDRKEIRWQRRSQREMVTSGDRRTEVAETLSAGDLLGRRHAPETEREELQGGRGDLEMVREQGRLQILLGRLPQRSDLNAPNRLELRWLSDQSGQRGRRRRTRQSAGSKTGRRGDAGRPELEQNREGGEERLSRFKKTMQEEGEGRLAGQQRHS